MLLVTPGLGACFGLGLGLSPSRVSDGSGSCFTWTCSLSDEIPLSVVSALTWRPDPAVPPTPGRLAGFRACWDLRSPV